MKSIPWDKFIAAVREVYWKGHRDGAAVGRYEILRMIAESLPIETHA